MQSFNQFDQWIELDGVSCGWIKLDKIDLPDNKLTPLLSSTEVDRWRRFRFERDARRFLVRAAWRRYRLAEAMDVNPQALEYRESPLGKPELANGGMQFNASHADGLAMLATHPNHRVGVDAERLERGQHWTELAATVLHPTELTALRALNENAKSLRFIQYWVGKEALLKAAGFGLNVDPRQIALEIEGETIKQIELPETLRGKWRLRLLQLTPEVAAALVVDHG